ncbi:MAG TPA: hypothetical protein VNB22_10320 [Pyrinomonadaceae bacterium]|jgi:hypothetical protein|nr:hypothetical protein [Pyrinomonadaceae bacterium]
MRQLNLSTDFEITFRGSYVHILLAENYEITPMGVEKMWIATIEACRTYQCNKVLSEGNIHSRKLKAWDAYSSGSQASEVPGLRHACLFYNYQPDDMSEFFKTVSANRGINVEFFTDKEKALKWLGVTVNG